MAFVQFTAADRLSIQCACLLVNASLSVCSCEFVAYAQWNSYSIPVMMYHRIPISVEC